MTIHSNPPILYYGFIIHWFTDVVKLLLPWDMVTSYSIDLYLIDYISKSSACTLDVAMLNKPQESIQVARNKPCSDCVHKI